MREARCSVWAPRISPGWQIFHQVLVFLLCRKAYFHRRISPLCVHSSFTVLVFTFAFRLCTILAVSRIWRDSGWECLTLPWKYLGCLPLGADTFPWYSFPISVRQKGASKSCGQASDKLAFVCGVFFKPGAKTATISSFQWSSWREGSRLYSGLHNHWPVQKSSKVEEEGFKAHCSESSCAHWSKRLLSPTVGAPGGGQGGGNRLVNTGAAEVTAWGQPQKNLSHEWGQRPLLVLFTTSPASNYVHKL